MKNIEMFDTPSGFIVRGGNSLIGIYDKETETFTKYDKRENRYLALKNGPGHGFPVVVYLKLKDIGCKTVQFNERTEIHTISFSTFTEKMEHRTAYGETKVFISMCCCDRENDDSPDNVNDSTNDINIALPQTPKTKHQNQLTIYLITDNSLEEVA